MAFGFPAYHTEVVSTYLPFDQLRSAVHQTIAMLGWHVKRDTPFEIQVSASVNLLSWGETLTIQFSKDGVISITSKCSTPSQCFDWGKNEANVNTFVRHFSVYSKDSNRGLRAGTEFDTQASWYVAIDDTQAGPISRYELISLVNEGKVTVDTLVWRKEMSEWMPAGRVVL